MVILELCLSQYYQEYIEFVMFSSILMIVNPCFIKLIYLDTMGMYRTYILCYDNIKAHSCNWIKDGKREMNIIERNKKKAPYACMSSVHAGIREYYSML